jgi:hypothetical protein
MNKFVRLVARETRFHNPNPVERGFDYLVPAERIETKVWLIAPVGRGATADGVFAQYNTGAIHTTVFNVSGELYVLFKKLPHKAVLNTRDGPINLRKITGLKTIRADGPGRQAGEQKLLQLFSDIFEASSVIVSTVSLERVTTEMNALATTENEALFDQVLADWMGMGIEEIEREVGAIKNKHRDSLSRREQFIRVSHVNLRAARSARLNPPTTMLVVTEPSPNWEVFKAAGIDQHLVWQFDVDKRAWQKFSVGAWKDGYHKLYTLIPMGRPGDGKSLISQAILWRIAEKEAHFNRLPKPSFIKTTKFDTLSDACREGLMKPYIGILVDDFTPSMKPRPHASVIDVDELKHATLVQFQHGVEAMGAREKDIKFAPNQPRIYPTNSSDIHEWYPQVDFYRRIKIPAGEDLEAPPPDVPPMDYHADAILRRCCFWNVQTRLFVQSGVARGTRIRPHI